MYAVKEKSDVLMTSTVDLAQLRQGDAGLQTACVEVDHLNAVAVPTAVVPPPLTTPEHPEVGVHASRSRRTGDIHRRFRWITKPCWSAPLGRQQSTCSRRVFPAAVDRQSSELRRRITRVMTLDIAP